MRAHTAGEGSGRGNFGRAPVVRPAPRAFSASEARAQGLQVMQDRFEPGVEVLNSHRCGRSRADAAAWVAWGACVPLCSFLSR